jgi:predicted HD superfamily hydrolase involved in NAD metabolism
MSIISELKKTTELSNHLGKDVRTLFERHGRLSIAEHTECVAENAAALAARFGISADLPVTAAYLHDLGQVLPKEQYTPAALEYGIDVLNEEHRFPGLLHQKLSKAIASEVFGIKDTDVLSAVECHTTLKAGASDIDLILFIADKLSWNTEESKPFIGGIHNGLIQSLQHAALSYISHLIGSKDTPVLHPWTLAAYEDLKQKGRI